VRIAKRRLLRNVPFCKSAHEWSDWCPEPYGDDPIRFCKKCSKTMTRKQFARSKKTPMGVKKDIEKLDTNEHIDLFNI
jgi:hypothetical protein